MGAYSRSSGLRQLLALLLLLLLASAALARHRRRRSRKPRRSASRSQPGNNAPVWREVRSGKEEYTSVKGRETGVLIQTWARPGAQLRNGWIMPIGGWLVVAGRAASSGLFHWCTGRSSCTTSRPAG